MSVGWSEWRSWEVAATSSLLLSHARFWFAEQKAERPSHSTQRTIQNSASPPVTLFSSSLPSLIPKRGRSDPALQGRKCQKGGESVPL